MFVIINCVNIEGVVHIDLLDYHTKKEYLATVFEDSLENLSCEKLNSLINNKINPIKIDYKISIAFKHLESDKVLMILLDHYLGILEQVNFNIKKSEVESSDDKLIKEPMLIPVTQYKNKIPTVESEVESSDDELIEKHKKLVSKKINPPNVSYDDDSSTDSDDTETIDSADSSDSNEDITDTDIFTVSYKKLVGKLKADLSIRTKKLIVALTDEITQLKSQVVNLESKIQQQAPALDSNPSPVPKCVVGMFYDWEFKTEKNGENNQIKVYGIKQIESKLLEFSIDSKEISIPYSQCLNGNQIDKQFHKEKVNYCYQQINYYKIDMFYNLEKLIIPTDVYFNGSTINTFPYNIALPNDSGAFENVFNRSVKKFNKYYDCLKWHNDIANNSTTDLDFKFCNLTLPKLKSLHLIGNTKNCVLVSVQPLMETISITEYDFEYKLKDSESIGSISININNIGLKFLCPFLPDSPDDLDVVLRTQFPKLKTIEYNFHTVKTEETEEYLVRLSSALKRYYKKLGLEVKINIY